MVYNQNLQTLLSFYLLLTLFFQLIYVISYSPVQSELYEQLANDTFNVYFHE